MLVDAADAFQCAHREGVLRVAVAGTLAFTLAMGFLLTLAVFQRHELRPGEAPAFLRDLGLERDAFLQWFPGRVAARRYARRRAK